MLLSATAYTSALSVDGETEDGSREAIEPKTLPVAGLKFHPAIADVARRRGGSAIGRCVPAGRWGQLRHCEDTDDI